MTQKRLQWMETRWSSRKMSRNLGNKSDERRPNWQRPRVMQPNDESLELVQTLWCGCLVYVHHVHQLKELLNYLISRTDECIEVMRKSKAKQIQCLTILIIFFNRTDEYVEVIPKSFAKQSEEWCSGMMNRWNWLDSVVWVFSLRASCPPAEGRIDECIE